MSQSPASEPVIRPFEYERDLSAVQRIWREVGWVSEDEDAKQLEHWLQAGTTLIATLNGDAECAVQIATGTMRLQHTDLALAAVTAVTTSRVARGLALAQRLTALQLVAAAQQGAAVSALGMFDQGFYDKLGFATGSYEHELQIDPGTLSVSVPTTRPRRLGTEDFAAMHAAMCQRRCLHGAVVIEDPRLYRAELAWDDNGFGLGYDTDGVLSHFIWLAYDDAEHGPYQLRWLCYQDDAQLLDLLGLLKSLADQVYSVSITEPVELQLQTLLQRPLRQRHTTEGSDHQGGHRVVAWWQFRVLDVPACVGAIASTQTLELGIEVSDPLAERLPETASWHGVAGRYRVSLGPQSRAIQDAPLDDLPLLKIGVGALTRLLWGIMPATSLQLMGELSGPPELLQQLDTALLMPRASVGWEF
ncbi:MAG: GNAT family N-acetyltransferase [Pseudomonadales bacterium]